MAIAAEQSTLDDRILAEQRAVSELAEQKRRLAAGGGNYSRETTLAVDRIREELPEANVQVLCDLVEPRSEEWQQAIEGYLDNARFNLIVKPEWEAVCRVNRSFMNCTPTTRLPRPTSSTSTGP
jgi:chromosome segregation ATPase